MLVRRIAVGVHEADGDRINLLLTECVESLSDRTLVDWFQNLARRRHTLDNTDTQMPRNQRRGGRPEQIIRRRPTSPADLDRIPKSVGTQEPDLRAAPFEQRVQADRRAVQKIIGTGEKLSTRGHTHCLDGAEFWRRRCRWHLANIDAACAGIIYDDIREGAANIYTNSR